MRLLFVSNLYPPHHIGGYELVCQRTAEGLRARGHDVRVLTSTFQSGPREDELVHRALSCAYQPPDHFPDASPSDADLNGSILAGEIAATRPDVVILWNLHGLGMLRLYSTALKEARQVATRVGDYQFWPNWDTSQSIPPELLSVLLDPRLRCAANCRTMGEDLARAGMDPRSIAVLYSPVESAGSPLPTPPSSPPPLRLLWAGRICRQKGLDVAVDAASILATKHGVPVRLSIAGKGDEMLLGSCLSKVTATGQGERASLGIEYLGPVDRAQLAQIFPRYHAYLAPSVGHEAFPMTCVEAMAAGVPVVASRLGGLVEITKGGRLGLLFEPGNADALARQLRRLSDEPRLRLRLRSTARRHVEVHFSPGVTIDRFEAFLAGCAQGLSVSAMPALVPKLSDGMPGKGKLPFGLHRMVRRLWPG